MQDGADAWGEVTKLTASDAQSGDNFGYSVAVSGDVIVVGATGESNNTGAAYVFQRMKNGPETWGEVAKLIAADAASYTYFFGGSVAISGDVIVVGAKQDGEGGIRAGAAFVFQRKQNGTDSWGEVTKLIASDAQVEDSFGYSVAISGDVIVVGASHEDEHGTDAGAAYVFQRMQGGTDAWGEVTKLTSSDAQPVDYFGCSVAVSGDVIVVGANHEDDGGNFAGAAYVFQRMQGGADAWGQTAKISASDATEGGYFGYSVAAFGDVIVVGAYHSESAYIFQPGALRFFIPNVIR
jgi:hypothetical protein